MSILECTGNAPKEDDYPNVHRCKKCPFVSKSISFMHDHMRSHGSSSDLFDCELSTLEAFRCKDCDFKTNIFVFFKKHLNEHQGGPPMEYTLRSYVCRNCPYQTNSSLHWMKHKCVEEKSLEINYTKDNAIQCRCSVCKLVLNGFGSYSSEEKKQIISQGRPTPPLKNLTKLTKSYTRHFQTEVYKKCEWLCGCEIKSLLFCWPCLMFSSEKNLWNKSGFSDLNNLHKLIKRHSTTQAHLKSIITEKTFGRVRTERMLDDQLRKTNEMHNQQVRKNREVLKRLIDAVCFLGVHELAFRGHNESETSLNRGNYVDLVNLIAKYDETLKCHLENSRVFKGTSNLIQNDLIAGIGEVVLKKIKSEVKETSFVSIALDETTDGNISRLSKVIRYVARNGSIKERFLGFHDRTDITVAALYDTVLSVVRELNCDSKLVAQSYDGATGELGKLQDKIKETYPSAIFVHCMTHRLNLVLEQSLCAIKECKAFFSTLNGMASFFSKRTSALDNKRLPTQWNYNGKLVQTVFEHRQPLINFFETTIEQQNEWDHETVICSRGYLDMLKSDVDFNLLLVIFAEIFPSADKLMSVLQNKSNDINLCIIKINEFRTIVVSKRDQFEHFWNKLQQLDVQDQAAASHRRLFCEIIDNISTHIDDRFKNFRNLKFTELVNFKDTTSISQFAFNSLKENYARFFDFAALRSELSVIYKTSEGLNKNSVSELWTSLKECGLQQACAEVVKLCELTLTIPLGASTVLKRIKSYKGNCTGQERLSHLALISVEKHLIEEMSVEQTFYDSVIEEFAKRDRRIALNFK